MKKIKSPRAGGFYPSNRSLTLRLLFSHGVMSRTDIADHLNISTAAVTSIVSDFLEEGLLVQQEEGLLEPQNQVGRRRLPIAVNYCWKYVLAIDIHLHSISIAITDMKGGVLTEQSLTPVPVSPQALCADIAQASLEMIAQAGIPLDNILGAGITGTGPINQDDGIALHLFPLFDEPFPIQQYFEKAFPFPVTVENMVCACLLSELRYTPIAEESQNILMLRWGPGVGSAMAIHGLIYKGYNYQSTEIGHNLIAETNGKKCNCGRVGCLEPTVSTDAIVEFIQEKISAYPAGVLASLAAQFGPPSRRNLPQYLMSASETLLDFMKDRAHALASVTNNAIHILAPDKLILIGDLFELDLMVELFEEQLYAINPRLPPDLCAKSRMAASQKYIGATAIAVERLLLPWDSRG